MLSESISIYYTFTPISGYPISDELKSSATISASLCSFTFYSFPTVDRKTVFIRPKISSIIVSYHAPSEEQSTFYYHIIYLLIILGPSHQDTLYQINYNCPTLSIPG